ncbi:ATP-binding protein [bacterium]|nr:ATP-binding protein [bacterium]
MKPVERYLAGQVRADLRRKMVFVGGPRQVGKTTLARRVFAGPVGYLNWDVAEHRERILKRELPSSSVWVFDEVHKYRGWRNYLKGLFDNLGKRQKILVTGSARLDYYRFGGDSLQGRYHYLRLHPFSVAELGIKTAKDFMSLLTLGGFPEPFLSGSETAARRWSREYRTRLIREDLTDIERMLDLGRLELMVLRLPELVGSPLSINGLREDLQVAHKTVANWLRALERLYAIFRLPPFGAAKIRAVKKEQKHYHFDWSLIPDESFRFENLVASHLLKWVHFEQDAKGRDVELTYFRDVDGREVDFVVTERGRPPLQLIECKWSDAPIGKGMHYLKARFPNTEAWQISATGKKNYVTPERIRVCPAIDFLSHLV